MDWIWYRFGFWDLDLDLRFGYEIWCIAGWDLGRIWVWDLDLE
ncbi:unnamed protein product, partial [Rotaria sp. Silwood1]